jgi:hypothetical protein
VSEGAKLFIKCIRSRLKLIYLELLKNVEDEFCHHLLWVAENLLHHGEILFAQWNDHRKDVFASEDAHQTLLDKSVDTLRVAFEVIENSSYFFHASFVVGPLRFHEVLNQMLLNLFVVHSDLFLCRFKPCE